MPKVFLSNLLILSLFIFCAWAGDNINKTLIQNLQITDNANVWFNAHIPQELVADIQNALEPLISSVRDNNQSINHGNIKLVETIEIARNHNISLNLYVDDQANGDDAFSIITEIGKAIIDILSAENNKTSDIRKMTISDFDGKINVSRDCDGVKLMLISNIAEILTGILEMVEEEKARLIDKLTFAINNKTDDISNELVKNGLEPIVDKISEVISSIIEKLGNENDKLVETLKTIRNNLKESISEKRGDLKRKLMKLKGTTETALNEVTTWIDSNVTHEIKSSLEALRVILVQLCEKITDFITGY